MNRWKYRCAEFKDVRESIDDEDYEGVINSLIIICHKYSKIDKDFADELTELAEELEYLEDYDEDDLNYYLGEMYDLCDAAGIWLDL